MAHSIKTSYSFQEMDYMRPFITERRDPKVNPRKCGPYPDWVNTYKIPNPGYNEYREAINMMGMAIAQDIDREIIKDLTQDIIEYKSQKMLQSNQ